MTKAGPEAVAEILALAGGEIIGRTRLQKAAYLLELAGVGYGFPFSYHRFGPYSEELSWAVKDSEALELLKETEERANWGGPYSVFRLTPSASKAPETDAASDTRKKLLSIVRNADAVALELAATFAFLAKKGDADPWGQVAKLKPRKAEAKLGEARALYLALASLEVPEPLPAAV